MVGQCDPANNNPCYVTRVLFLPNKVRGLDCFRLRRSTSWMQRNEGVLCAPNEIRHSFRHPLQMFKNTIPIGYPNLGTSRYPLKKKLINFAYSPAWTYWGPKSWPYPDRKLYPEGARECYVPWWFSYTFDTSEMMQWVDRGAPLASKTEV